MKLRGMPRKKKACIIDVPGGRKKRQIRPK